MSVESVLLVISAYLFLSTNVRFMLNRKVDKQNININFLIFNIFIAVSCILGLNHLKTWECVIIFMLSCSCSLIANFKIYEKKKVKS